MNVKKITLALVPAALTLAVSVSSPVMAQGTMTHKAGGMMHRHPMMTGMAAGMAAHHMAKHAHGGMMHRHPMMTGMAAGMMAHHMAKKH